MYVFLSLSLQLPYEVEYTALGLGLGLGRESTTGREREGETTPGGRPHHHPTTIVVGWEVELLVVAVDEWWRLAIRLQQARTNLMVW